MRETEGLFIYLFIHLSFFVGGEGYCFGKRLKGINSNRVLVEPSRHKHQLTSIMFLLLLLLLLLLLFWRVCVFSGRENYDTYPSFNESVD